MSKTDYQEGVDVDALTGLYAGLFVGSSDPGAGLESAVSGSGWAEAAYTNYARQAVTLGSKSGTGASAATRANTGALTFPAVATAPAVVRRVGFFDAATNGHCLYYSDTDLNTSVAVGVQPTFAIGALTVAED